MGLTIVVGAVSVGLIVVVDVVELVITVVAADAGQVVVLGLNTGVG